LVKIPITNENILSKTKSDIANFFKKIQYIYQDEKIIAIQMQQLHESVYHQVYKLKQNDELPPIIDELFGRSFQQFNTSNFIKTYKIDCSKIQSYYNDSFDEVWDFLCDSFFRLEGGIFIQPVSWTLNEELLLTVTLRYFSSKTKNIYLITDDSSKQVKSIFIKP
jgi:hypothetical protein